MVDHLTHIVIAYKVLDVCGCDKKAAIYSLLPAIDREPAHFHRLYAHIIHNFPAILKAALKVFARQDISLNKNSYEYKRVAEDKDYFLGLVREALAWIKDKSILEPSPDLLSAGISMLSHIYIDTFNNPVQAFLPESVYASGQWDFWNQVDYLVFRSKFYSEFAIKAFRSMLSKSDVWEVESLDPFALVKAMIIRLGDLSRPHVGYEVVDWKIRVFLRFLGCNQYKRCDRELGFCKKLEEHIKELIMRCLGEGDEGS